MGQQLLRSGYVSCNKWTNPTDFTENFGYASLRRAIINDESNAYI